MNMNELPTIGEPIAGGYFAGVVRVDGDHFGVIVAPKSGEYYGTWDTYGTKLEGSTIGDGYTNTVAMLNAGSDIATQAAQLDINGYQDWYVPSRDELEMIYRNLKPLNSANHAGFRDGENPSSEPFGELYTQEIPAQTTVPAFQYGGAEAMELDWYWSSSQYSDHFAFTQNFVDGGQGCYQKFNVVRVRPVRRFLIETEEDEA